MAKQSINTLKNWFKRGLKPLQQQFWDWLDSYWHKDETIPIDKIDGLATILNNIPSQETIDELLDLISDNVYTYSDGSEYVIPDRATVVYIDPVTPQALLSVTLPDVPASSNEVVLLFGGQITDGPVVDQVFLLATEGRQVLQGTVPSVLLSGESIAYRFNPVNQKWYRKH